LQEAADHGSHFRPVTQNSDGYDDFADLLIRLKKTVRINNVFQREATGDQRLQASGGKAVYYEAFSAVQALLFPDNRKQRIAAQDEILRKRREQGKWCRFPSQGAVKKNNATIAHCGGQSLD